MTAPQPGARARHRRLAAIAVASLVPAVLDATHALARGARIEVPYLAFLTAGTLVLLVVLTATFDECVRRRVSNTTCFVVSFALAIALGVVEGFAGRALANAFDPSLVQPEHGAAVVVVRMGAVDGFLALCLWAAAVVLPFAVGDAQARAAEAERLRAVAELARLRASLQPHFLFNTLSTVAGLVGSDPREARVLIGALGDLLRESLGDLDEMQTLDDEVTWLKRYAGILETRHRGFVAFRWDIAEATRGVRIPRLLLQPLLENAVQHGALRRPEGGEVALRTTMEPGDGRLTCIVEDNGPGPASPGKRPGLGIDIVTRRLALKYAGAASFRLETGDGHTRSIVELPAEVTP